MAMPTGSPARPPAGPGSGDVGVLTLDNELPRPPGDVGNPETFGFGVTYTTIEGAGTRQVVEHSADGLLGSTLAALRRLAATGVRTVSTCCGYLAIFQAELAAASPVPVAASSLLQIPLVLRTLGPEQKVCVLTVDGRTLTPRHFAGAGLGPQQLSRVVVAGLEHTEHFHAMIVGETAELDVARAEGEVVAAARQAAAADPAVCAFVFECTNLPPYAAAVRAATGLPVWDATTLIGWLRGGTATGSWHTRDAR
ncbi:MAG TPA: aspartate/glutamate racemase family protein [Streptosporangiaceae bacterium]